MDITTENLLKEYQSLLEKHKHIIFEVSDLLSELKALSIMVELLSEAKKYTDEDSAERAFSIVSGNIKKVVEDIKSIISSNQ